MKSWSLHNSTKKGFMIFLRYGLSWSTTHFPCFPSRNITKNVETHPPLMRDVIIEQFLYVSIYIHIYVIYIYIYIYILLIIYIYTYNKYTYNELRKGREVNKNSLFYQIVSPGGYFSVNISNLRFVWNQIYLTKIWYHLLLRALRSCLLECFCWGFCVLYTL